MLHPVSLQPTFSVRTHRLKAQPPALSPSPVLQHCPVLQLCPPALSSSTVPQPCPPALSSSSVLQHCPPALSSSSVLQLCPPALSSSSVLQLCPPAPSSSPVPQHCPPALSSSTVLQPCPPALTEWTQTERGCITLVTVMTDRNSIPPTTTLSNFREKQQEVTGKCFVDTVFWGGVILGNQLELWPMIQAGVAGFKCFLIHSGMEEFPHVTDYDPHSHEASARHRKCPLFSRQQKRLVVTVISHHRSYSTFLQSTPDVIKLEAICRVTQLCLQYQVRCHIVHLSSAKPLKLIQKVRQSGAPLAVETTHHYLRLCSELTTTLKAGHIDMVAWGGISSLQFGNYDTRKRGFELSDVARLLSQKTAQLCSLDSQKGRLAPGYDADLNFDFLNVFVQLTPFLGITLQGVVCATILRGQLVYRDGSFCPEPLGKHLLIPQWKKKIKPSCEV
uniref:Amidohydrolase-related domain-containing protein n=1 Tax=Monopterus albus TaxID=43700 RepID=A0A3Q3K296_MONAL